MTVRQMHNRLDRLEPLLSDPGEPYDPTLAAQWNNATGARCHELDNKGEALTDGERVELARHGRTTGNGWSAPAARYAPSSARWCRPARATRLGGGADRNRIKLSIVTGASSGSAKRVTKFRCSIVAERPLTLSGSLSRSVFLLIENTDAPNGVAELSSFLCSSR